MGLRFLVNGLLNRNLYYGKKIIHSLSDGNTKIYDSIKRNQPFMASRIGSTELSVLLYYYKSNDKKEIHWPEIYKTQLNMNSGFFPSSDKMLTTFCSFFIEHLKNIDVLGVWFNEGEDLMVKNFAPNSYLTFLRSLEPYYFKKPWSKSLQGKKILVIHPFSETIQKQFMIKNKLFNNKNTLPEFSLDTITAVQSLGTTKNKFSNWFEAYDYSCSEILKKDFDIAIIGAGAYGLPLASFVKSIGKIAIHMGGATQILFGIRGKRWDTHPVISKLYNNYWVRPQVHEIPTDTKLPEDGCYW